MLNLLPLIKETSAFNGLLNDKKTARLSHAYLFIMPDEEFMGEILRIFASVIICDDAFNLSCRNSKLVLEGLHPDVISYPKKKETVTAEEVSDLIENTFVKPFEGDKKIFLINNADKMNITAQNKLLKTLEEPPKNTYILLGAKNESSLLSTVKSRTKIFNLFTFDSKTLFEFLSKEYIDEDKLRKAISCGDGTIQNAIELYKDESLGDSLDFISDMLVNMKSSKDVLTYTVKFTNQEIELYKFLELLEIAFRDLLVYKNGQKNLVKNPAFLQEIKDIDGLKTGTIIDILERIIQAKERLDAQSKPEMVVEWLFFQILEVKYKWQKL